MTRTLALVFSALFPLVALAADGAAPADDEFVRPAGDSELDDFSGSTGPSSSLPTPPPTRGSSSRSTCCSMVKRPCATGT